MIIKSFFDLTKKEKDKFYFELANTKIVGGPAAENMWADDWKNKNNTLPFLLEKRTRFNSPNGDFYIVYDDEKFVACSGVYKSDFSKCVALAGTRMWIEKEYRNQHISREVLLPIHKKWAIDNECKTVALCFNDYNKSLIKTWTKQRMGETRSPRQPHHMFYQDFNELTFPVEIQYTKQWVIYERLDPNWDFSWDSIKYIDNKDK